jgi:LytS/YehU family sensor histidine kinase
MKITLSTIILSLGILMSNLYAQMPGNMTPPDFNAEKAAGIFQYDIEKVIKKLKIIDDYTKSKVTESLNHYNSKMYELSILHAATFQKLEADFDRNVQIAMRNRDRNQMNGVKAEIQRIIPPIRLQVQNEEKFLNNAMADFLTVKQNKKWLRYQNGKKTN